MTEQGRILGIKERSCGLQSPPRKWAGCVGVLSSSAFGNMPADWSWSQQSPPQVVKMSVVNRVWNM